MAELSEKATEVAKKAPKAAKKVVKEIAESDIEIAAVTNDVTEYIADGADALSEQFAHAADISRGLTPRQIGIVSAAVVIGVAAGGYVGYRLAEKKLSTKFEALLEEETAKLRQHYVEKAALEVKPNLDDVVASKGYTTEAERLMEADELRAKVEDLGYTPQGERIEIVEATPQSIMKEVMGKPEEPKVEVHVETVNVFEQRDAAAQPAEWDYSAELKTRDPRYPYIIHVDEFRTNEAEYEQADLTFYEGDDVLAEDDDSVISDVDTAVGQDNLHKFGHGSGDPNVVFIRNDVREVLYEVTKSFGKYTEEVLGLDPPEIRHSDDRPGRRGRFDDD